MSKLTEKLEGKTPQQKLRFLYRVGERLRIQHNRKGEDFTGGVITEAEWTAYQDTFYKRQQRVLNKINNVRDNQGLFDEASKDVMLIHKKDGIEATDLDVEIDEDNIEE